MQYQEAGEGMKQVRGEARKLLIVIGRLQSMIGSARGLHENDRDPMGYEMAQRKLSEAFELCVATTGKYPPVPEK